MKFRLIVGPVSPTAFILVSAANKLATESKTEAFPSHLHWLTHRVRKGTHYWKPF